MATITIDNKPYEVPDEVAQDYRKKSESANDLILVKRERTELQEQLETLRKKYDGDEYKQLRAFQTVYDKIPETYRSEDGISRLLRAREHAEEYELLKRDYDKLENKHTKLKESIPKDFDAKRYVELDNADKRGKIEKVLKERVTNIIKAKSEEAKFPITIEEPFMGKAWSNITGFSVDDTELDDKIAEQLSKAWKEQIAYNEKILGDKKALPEPGISGEQNGNKKDNKLGEKLMLSKIV